MALTCSGSNIDVHIDDPLDSSNNSMKMLLPYLYFNILYWEGPSFSQVEPPPPSSTLPLFRFLLWIHLLPGHMMPPPALRQLPVCAVVTDTISCDVDDDDEGASGSDGVGAELNPCGSALTLLFFFVLAAVRLTESAGVGLCWLFTVTPLCRASRHVSHHVPDPPGGLLLSTLSPHASRTGAA